ncbi:hypothetical protein J3R30DRAFT_3316408 [Lentinula aciculospora]|uniref:Uncharacterized protein n=1 Tax=Lentinula aciculospora TaxID=153920 RepID=A0A9W8ZRZ5_9AGAR|nr:hypothetical protein J3R30DRAFT_3316408 [Lentinula aciculospora]
MNIFVDNCEKVVADWEFLLRKVTVPSDVTSSHPSVVAAFQMLDGIMSGGQTMYLLRRLAFVEFIWLSDTLEGIVKSERNNGASQRSGLGDASLMINIYERAQSKNLPAEQLKGVIRERRRTGRCFNTLAGPSTLFLLVYSDVAKTLV